MKATLTLDTKRSLRFKADEFNNLRGFIILQQMNSAVEMIGMRILMECMDAVRDLKIGETIYCVPARSNCYWGKDLAKVNDRANYWERKSKEHADYKPNWGYAFAFKRTEKSWVYMYIDYKFIFLILRDMESIIGHIYEHQSTDLRNIYIIKGVENKRYVMTRIMLHNDRSSFVDNDYRLSVTVVKQQIERSIITQIYPAPPVKTVKVKFHDGITREVPIGSYIVQYWNAGEWQNIASFPDTLEGNKEAQKLMNDWEWESQLIKLT